MPGWDFGHVQDDVNPHILRMFRGTFLLDDAQVMLKHNIEVPGPTLPDYVQNGMHLCRKSLFLFPPSSIPIPDIQQVSQILTNKSNF